MDLFACSLWRGFGHWEPLNASGKEDAEGRDLLGWSFLQVYSLFFPLSINLVEKVLWKRLKSVCGRGSDSAGDSHVCVWGGVRGGVAMSLHPPVTHNSKASPEEANQYHAINSPSVCKKITDNRS